MVTIVAGNNELNVQMTLITGTLFGVVTDASTGAPIQGVAVSLNGASTSTNSSGAYAFAGIVPGSYTIIFSKSGYQTITY